MRRAVTVFIVLFAALNLVFWLFCAEKLWGEDAVSVPAELLEDDRGAAVTLTVPDTPLVWDGSGTPDFLSGVSAVNGSGEDVSHRVTVSVTGGGNKERTLVYQLVQTDSRTVTAARTLYLENYSGPAIVFTGGGETVGEEDIPSLVMLLSTGGVLSADDGFGHDITAAVQITCDTEITGDGSYSFTFTVGNLLGDTATLHTALSVRAKQKGPTLRLTASAVTLPVGGTFDAASFISAAWDDTDGDLSGSVRVEGNVDTGTPGVYRLTYTLSNLRGEEAAPQTLVVTVVK
ncbi:MAG: DUF5011 domain-containing protein [Clostridia bacterium]|nr:DUF5011 domain-containing protein [Clostridia bacterium]